MSKEYEKINYEELAEKADTGLRGQGSVVKMMGYLRDSIIQLDNTTKYFSKILVALTIILVIFSLPTLLKELGTDNLLIPIRLNQEKISSIISIIVAIVIMIASYFQWWNITYNGKFITKRWVKVLFAILIFALIISLSLLLK